MLLPANHPANEQPSVVPRNSLRLACRHVGERFAAPVRGCGYSVQVRCAKAVFDSLGPHLNCNCTWPRRFNRWSAMEAGWDFSLTLLTKVVHSLQARIQITGCAGPPNRPAAQLPGRAAVRLAQLPGPAWPGSAWPGSAWPGPAWPGPAPSQHKIYDPGVCDPRFKSAAAKVDAEPLKVV